MDNMFDMLMEKREQEQKAVEQTCKSPQKTRKIPTTILLEPDAKIALKKYSADSGLTASDVINTLIRKYCAKYFS